MTLVCLRTYFHGGGPKRFSHDSMISGLDARTMGVSQVPCTWGKPASEYPCSWQLELADLQMIKLSDHDEIQLPGAFPHNI
ncbi:uncharacterized protein YALI1_F28123g [Yarrowia lipolytica]|uniref:Uncharacterized protein n=1 Tax=Yarrowia lipolytica TaxID=4952 RepID=A0A1D8NPF1_YARLL|nr:hypothetical protein YALI1_F28123g [Yarrowia lipolytica]